MLKLPYKSIQLVHKSAFVNKNWITVSCHLSDTVIYLLTRKSRNEENWVAVCTFWSTDLSFVKQIEKNEKKNHSEKSLLTMKIVSHVDY